VLEIVAGILVARHLKTTEDLFDSRPSPRTKSLVASAVQWAERIMRRIDGVFANSSDDERRWAASLEETLISVWRQALVEESKAVTVNGMSFPVLCTSRSGLREVDFQLEDQALRGLEQTPRENFALGTTGTRRKEGHAVPKRRALHCRCRGWNGAVLRERASFR
jgi:hypothetical protein